LQGHFPELDVRALHQFVGLDKVPHLDTPHGVDGVSHCVRNRGQRREDRRSEIVHADGLRVHGDVYIVQLMPDELTAVFKVKATLI
jgi:hypothetical protein